MRHLLNQLWQTGVDLLFPPTCVGCDAIGHHLCPRCAQMVEPLPSTICTSCGRPQRHFTTSCNDCQKLPSNPLTAIKIAALYTHPLQQAIRRFKFSEGKDNQYPSRPELAVPLSRYLTVTFMHQLLPDLPSPIDAIVPVPLHEERLAARGYNQAELLAAPLAHAVNLPLRPHLLHRTRMTAQQSQLSAAERQANVADAFAAHSAVAGQHILLVDDVCTMGATLRACADAALQGGARAVSALALATPVDHLAHIHHV